MNFLLDHARCSGTSLRRSLLKTSGALILGSALMPPVSKAQLPPAPPLQLGPAAKAVRAVALRHIVDAAVWSPDGTIIAAFGVSPRLGGKVVSFIDTATLTTIKTVKLSSNSIGSNHIRFLNTDNYLIIGNARDDKGQNVIEVLHPLIADKSTISFPESVSISQVSLFGMTISPSDKYICFSAHRTTRRGGMLLLLDRDSGSVREFNFGAAVLTHLPAFLSENIICAGKDSAQTLLQDGPHSLVLKKIEADGYDELSLPAKVRTLAGSHLSGLVAVTYANRPQTLGSVQVSVAVIDTFTAKIISEISPEISPGREVIFRPQSTQLLSYGYRTDLKEGSGLYLVDHVSLTATPVFVSDFDIGLQSIGCSQDGRLIAIPLLQNISIIELEPSR